MSVSLEHRPELTKLLDQLRPGDALVVWRLDRIGRSIRHLIDQLQALGERGVGFRPLQETIDTTSAGGRLVFHVFAALAEFERDLIRERTHAGLAAARARGPDCAAAIRAAGHDGRADRRRPRCQPDHSVPGATTRERAGCGSTRHSIWMTGDFEASPLRAPRSWLLALCGSSDTSSRGRRSSLIQGQPHTLEHRGDSSRLDRSVRSSRRSHNRRT
jgi:hypothetical protein